jgi:hypothetical protein
VTAEGGDAYEFEVTFASPAGVDPFYIEGDEISVTGPNNFRQVPTFVGNPPEHRASSVTFRYRIAAPGGRFDAADRGVYRVEVAPGQVLSTSGVVLTAGPIGTFMVDVPLPEGPDLEAVSLTGAVPPSVVTGAGVRQKVKPLLFRVTNSGNQPMKGAATIRVVASPDTTADVQDPVVASLDDQRLNLAPGKSKVFKLKPRVFPAVADGDYHLVGVVDPLDAVTERRESNNWVSLGAPVHFAAPFVDLGLASPTLKGKLAPGKNATLLVTARNDGNQPATGCGPCA